MASAPGLLDRCQGPLFGLTWPDDTPFEGMIETVEELNSLRLATEQPSHTPAKLSLSEGRKEIPESVLETTRFVDSATDPGT